MFDYTPVRLTIILSIIFFTFSSCSSPKQGFREPLDYVDPMIGTTELGNTFPAVCLPFGLAKWTPQTSAGERKGHKPFDYKDNKLQGIRWTNFISGSAVPEYGSATIMAITGNLETAPEKRASLFSHDNETATPYYYSVALQDYQIKAECTSTLRTGYLRFTFPETDSAYILVQPNNTPKAPHTHGDAFVQVIPEKNEIVGSNPAFRYYISTGKPAGFSGHFVARFSKPFKTFGTWTENETNTNSTETKGQPGAYIKFDTKAGDVVEVKIGCSFTSIEQARKNLDAENQEWDFETVKNTAKKTWQDALGKIEVQSSDEEAKTNFYTALYHSLLLPRVFGDADGSYVGFADDNDVHKATSFTYYDDYSMWDTFRAQHPLLLILEPVLIKDMIQSLLVKADQGGWLPIFPSWNSYTTEMIGDHCISMIVDAYKKGFQDFDTEKAFSYMRKNATEMPENKADYVDGKGRRALDDYLQLGYIPMENPVLEAFHKGEQVSRTLEYAYDDFCLAEFAKELGKKSDYKKFQNQAFFYKNVFDISTGFVRGRHRDGRWDAQFDPGKNHKYITEATPWVYTWFVPHDVQGLIDLMGDRQTFIKKLDTFFAQGFYRQDNEPSHQIPYLYSFAGAPWKTQEQVRKAMIANYNTGPAGLSGNDDAGQMSAWLIFSSMGFYPVCPGTTQYVFGSPIFEKVTIHLDDRFYAGKTFVLEAQNASEENIYVQSVTINGKEWTKPWFDHAVIKDGGHIVMKMGAEPNKELGADPQDAPYSMTSIK